MGYSNNTTSLPLTNKVNLYSDGCGDNYEEKYYTNGAYIDLCGLTIEEYMSNPCCGCNSGISSSKPKNKVKIITFEEDGNIYHQAIASYPVTSTIKVRIISKDTNTVTDLEIYPGETTSKPEIGDSFDIKDVTLNIAEDNDFQYTTIIGGNSDIQDSITYDVYTASIPRNEAENLTADKISSFQLTKINNGTTIDLSFIIPGTDINAADMEENELNEFCENNQYAFVIVLPKNLYDNNLYSIFNYSGVDVAYKFKYDSLHIINSESFTCLVEKADNDIMPYVPLYKEDLEFQYKLTIAK
jgi:hypothetical protein